MSGIYVRKEDFQLPVKEKKQFLLFFTQKEEIVKGALDSNPITVENKNE